MFELGLWYAIIGLLLAGVGLGGATLKRLPLTTAMVYLGAGAALAGVGMLDLDLVRDARLFELASEIVVVVSLFVAGLKLPLPLTDRRWAIPLRLATVSMVVTVGLVVLIGVYGLGLSLGAAVVLGAVLAPTDPVLASDVQVTSADDRDRLRFGLTGEAGLNDGTAFPFVMLGLGLLGLHDIGETGLRWLLVDVLWATAAGLVIGAAAGTLVARLGLALRRRRAGTLGPGEIAEASALDEVLPLGVLALAYGAALMLGAYGFLAAFAAGLALRRVERRANATRSADAVEADARRADPDIAAGDDALAEAHMTAEATRVNELLERIGELAVVVITGAAIIAADLPRAALWVVPLLLVVVRPIGVAVGLLGAPVARGQAAMMMWFGMRGIGSVYYLAFALHKGFAGPEADLVTGIVLATIAVSVVAHGVSVTPLMRGYEARRP